MAKTSKMMSSTPAKETVDDSSVAKLFEEVKICFKIFADHIEGRVDPEYKRRRRLHPNMIEELMHMGKMIHPLLAF